MAKLHFFYSTMNAGKSTALLQSNHNYLESNLKTILFLLFDFIISLILNYIIGVQLLTFL